MGYRAHINTKRIIEYKGGDFNHCPQELANFLYDLKDKMNETEKEEYLFDCPFYIWNDYELLEDWDIEREWLEKAIDYILNNKNLDDEAFNEYTYKNVIDIFEYWLQESKEEDNFSNPDFVYISWF